MFSSQLGILLHVLGSLLIVYGQTIVKVSHVIVETSKDGGAGVWFTPPPPARPASWRRPDGSIRYLMHNFGSKLYACGGWTLFAVGNVLRFVSMRFGSQTVLSGLSSLQFVVIPFASYQLLGVTSNISTYIGMGVLLVGNMLILINGPGGETTGWSVDALRGQWLKPDMKKFLFGIGFVMAGMHVVWRVIHHRRRVAEAQVRVEKRKALRRKRSMSRSGSFGSFDMNAGGVVGGSMFSPNTHGDALELSPGGGGVPVHDPSTSRMFTAALLFSAVSAFVGAWSVLFSKSLTYIFGAVFGGKEGEDVLDDWYTWVVVGGFLLSAGFWVRQSDKGLKLYPATLIMPVMQAFWLAMSVLQGMIYFDEYEGLSEWELGWLGVGLVLAIGGALLMGLAGFFHEGGATARGQVGGEVEMDDLEASASSGRLDSPSLGSTASLSDLLVTEQIARERRR